MDLLHRSSNGCSPAEVFFGRKIIFPVASNSVEAERPNQIVEIDATSSTPPLIEQGTSNQKIRDLEQSRIT